MMQFPNTKETKDAIRSAIGIDTSFIIKGDATACTVCSGADLYDSVNKLSLNQFCTTCSGAYWLVQDIESSITSRVRWRVGDEEDFGIAGTSLVGDCIVTIGIDDLSDNQISNIREIVVDKRRLRIYRSIKRGVPDRDRVRFICKLVGEE